MSEKLTTPGSMEIADRLEHCAKYTGLDAVRELLLEAALAIRKRDAVILQAVKALENSSPAAWASRVDSDTMKSIWRTHVEALAELHALRPDAEAHHGITAQAKKEGA